MTSHTMSAPMDKNNDKWLTTSIWDRYTVLENSGEVVSGDTFVLHMDDPYAKAAMLAYARAIQSDVPEIASQIWERFPDDTQFGSTTY